MRVPRPRFTLRSAMVLVACAGVAGWLLLAAERVRTEPGSGTVCHLGRYRDNGEPFAYGHGSSPRVFWSKYWRKVLGRPWPGSFACPCKSEFERDFGRGREVEYLATSNDMNEMHDLMRPLMIEFQRSRKVRKPRPTGMPDSPQ